MLLDRFLAESLQAISEARGVPLVYFQFRLSSVLGVAIYPSVVAVLLLSSAQSRRSALCQHTFCQAFHSAHDEKISDGASSPLLLLLTPASP